MSGPCDDHLLDVGRHMTHDRGLQWTEGLFSSHGEHRHRQLHLFEYFVVLRVLGERSKLRKPCPHSPWLRIGGREEVSRGLVRFPRIAGEVVPYPIKVD